MRRRWTGGGSQSSRVLIGDVKDGDDGSGNHVVLGKVSGVVAVVDCAVHGGGISIGKRRGGRGRGNDGFTFSASASS